MYGIGRAEAVRFERHTGASSDTARCFESDTAKKALALFRSQG